MAEYFTLKALNLRSGSVVETDLTKTVPTGNYSWLIEFADKSEGLVTHFAVEL